MRLTLQVRFDDASGKSRTFTRNVNRPYPCVPRVGDGVFIGEVRSDGTMLQARRVAEVQWENDGSVSLLFRIDGLTNDPEPQVAALLDEGFWELPSASLGLPALELVERLVALVQCWKPVVAARPDVEFGQGNRTTASTVTRPVGTCARRVYGLPAPGLLMCR